MKQAISYIYKPQSNVNVSYVFLPPTQSNDILNNKNMCYMPQTTICICISNETLNHKSVCLKTQIHDLSFGMQMH